MSKARKYYETHTPYTNYLNYSQNVRGPWTQQNRNYKNVCNSIDGNIRPWINEKSKRIANSKNISNASVHSRLHQQAMSRQKIEKRQNNNSFSTEKRFNVSDLHPTESKPKHKRKKGKSLHAPYCTTLNYGMRLYQKGLQKMEEIERKHQEAIAKRELEELKDHTFHPKILPVSNNNKSRADERPEDILLRKGMLAQDKIEQKRAEMLYEVQQANSFQPNINDNSRKIAGQRSQFFEDDYAGDENSNQFGHQSDQFLNLYDDAMKRVERHDKIYSMWIDSEWTFKPDIGKTEHMNVSHRYNKSKNQISGKLMIEQFNNEHFDPVTGQPFFQPKINKSPLNQNHRNWKSIGNLLYDTTKIYKDKNNLRVKQIENEIHDKLNTRSTNKNSEALLEKMKTKRFAIIFNMLDSNFDGLVSAQKIDISKLTPDLLEIMTPLFSEMEEMGQTLDISEFIEATKLLYNTLSVYEKNKLLAINGRWEYNRENYKTAPSFEPQINKKSEQLARMQRNPGEKLEDALFRKKNETEERLYKIRRRKYNDELAGCTFHPNIQSYPANFRPVFQNMDENMASYINPISNKFIN
jgi:hypothetical protein